MYTHSGIIWFIWLYSPSILILVNAIRYDSIEKTTRREKKYISISVDRVEIKDNSIIWNITRTSSAMRLCFHLKCYVMNIVISRYIFDSINLFSFIFSMLSNVRSRFNMYIRMILFCFPYNPYGLLWMITEANQSNLLESWSKNGFPCALIFIIQINNDYVWINTDYDVFFSMIIFRQ